MIYSFILTHHALEAMFAAPTRYPDIYPVTNAVLSFSVFAASWLAALYELAWQLVMMTGFGMDFSRNGRLKSSDKVN